MIKHKEIKDMLTTNNGKWDNKIAFSVKEIQEMLGIPPSTTQELCKNGTLKTFKIGRKYLILRKDLYNYIQSAIDDNLII